MERLTLKQRAFGIILMLLMTPSISDANPLPIYLVEFVVQNQKQQPITDAIITLGSVTNPPGEYFFEIDEPGNYDYVAVREGYHNAIGVVHVIENNFEPIVEEVTLFILCGFIIHDTTGPAGEDILIETEIINTGFQFLAFQVDIILPEGFGYVQGSAFLNPERKADHMIIGNILPGTNTLRMIAFSLTNAVFYGESGIIASFTLTTPDVPGNYQLLPVFSFGDICPYPINLLGTVTLTPPETLPGDSNCDGIVSTLDVITTISYILGNNPQPFCFENADVNGDGSVNALDVIGTINIILGSGFVCGTSTITDIDGNVYNTVLIGSQCWMKENLKTTKYRNGMPIEYPGEDNIAWANNTSGAYAWYNNEIIWKDSYGALYNWHAVYSVNGLCPTGWHVPSDTEWNNLILHLDSGADPNAIGSQSEIAGGKLKSTRTAPEAHPRWNSPNTGAGNESNWTGFPGGYRSVHGTYATIGYYGSWWSYDENQPDEAWTRYLSYFNAYVYRASRIKTFGYSIRCLKN